MTPLDRSSWSRRTALSAYLRDAFAIQSTYVQKDFWGEDGRWRGGYAWLEHHGLIVDITRDQFG